MPVAAACAFTSTLPLTLALWLVPPARLMPVARPASEVSALVTLSAPVIVAALAPADVMSMPLAWLPLAEMVRPLDSVAEAPVPPETCTPQASPPVLLTLIAPETVSVTVLPAACCCTP